MKRLPACLSAVLFVLSSSIAQASPGLGGGMMSDGMMGRAMAGGWMMAGYVLLGVLLVVFLVLAILALIKYLRGDRRPGP